MSDEIYGTKGYDPSMGDEPPRVIDKEPESKIAHLNVHDNPMKMAQHIIRAIVDYDEDLYELVMCKHAAYPDEEDDKYHDGTADYNDDVDWAELYALVGAIEYMSEKLYHKDCLLRRT